MVGAFIKDNPYCSYDEIEAETQLSRGSIYNIIHEFLKMKKITSRWVAHELTQKNKADRVRIWENLTALSGVCVM